MIHDLGLAVSLGVVGCRQLDLNTKYLTELSPKGQNELRAVIREDGVWRAKVAPHMVNEQGSHFLSSGCLVAGNRNGFL